MLAAMVIVLQLSALANDSSDESVSDSEIYQEFVEGAPHAIKLRFKKIPTEKISTQFDEKTIEPDDKTDQ